MNKETRTFILGLLVLIPSLTGFSIHVIEMVNGTWKCSTSEIFLFICSLVGVGIGAEKVYKTTD